LPAPWGASPSSTGKVTTSYDFGTGSGGTVGRLSTITEQASVPVVRTNVQDALGRLAEVSEGCTGCVTTYNYDALDNLNAVTQGGQTRNFTFDSLKRLSSAVNPENGTTSYQYDN
jgi:YD repeat-containing protein